MLSLEQKKTAERVKEEFETACLKCKRPEVFNLVSDKMNSVDCDDECTMKKVMIRAEKGSSSDLATLIEEIFVIPLGLQASLARILIKHCHFSKPLKATNELTLELERQECGKSSWSKWRNGQMDQSEFFSSVSSAVVSGEMNRSVAKNLTSFMLQTSGYDYSDKRSAQFLNRRLIVEASHCDLHQVSRIFPGGGSFSAGGEDGGVTATVCTYDGRYVLLSGNENRQLVFGATPDHSVNRSTPSVSTDALHWEHSSGPSNQLLLRRTKKLGRDTFQSSQISPPGKQVLVIGDCIRLACGLLEVDEVIAVDLLLTTTSSTGRGEDNETQDIVVLVEGRMMNGANWCNGVNGASHMVGIASVVDRFGEEGASELGGRDDVSHSSEGSGIEDNRNVIQLAVLHKRYFCVFAVSFRGVVTAQHVVAVHDSLAPDQIPTRVVYAERGMALVSGSNGLVGAAHLTSSEKGRAVENKDDMASSYTDLEKEAENRVGSPDKKGGKKENSPRRVIHHVPCFQVFTMDSLVVGHPVEPLLSHAGDATVTSTSYSSAAKRLASGDTDGVVCIWRVNVNTGQGNLLAGPLKLSDNKVCSVQMSPSGLHVAVALWDRLLLLAIQPVTENHRQPQPSTIMSVIPQHILVARSTLDILNNIPAKYAVAFVGGDQSCLRVWRVTQGVALTETETIPPSRVTITSWLHPNLDSFDKRFLPDEPFTGIASSTRTRAFTTFSQQYNRKSSANNLCEEQIFSLEDDPFFSQNQQQNTNNSSSKQQDGVLSAAQSCASMQTDGEDLMEGGRVEDVLQPRSYLRVDGEYLPVYQTAFVNLDQSAFRNAIERSRMKTLTAHCDDKEIAEEDVSGKTGVTCIDTQCSGEYFPGNATSICDSPLFPGDQPGGDSEHLARLLRPMRGARIHKNATRFTTQLVQVFQHDCSERFMRVRIFLAVYCACLQAPTVGLLAAALELSAEEVILMIEADMTALFEVSEGAGDKNIVTLNAACMGLNSWLCSNDYHRIGRDFWVDMAFGHNRLCALYLRHCGNKSVAVEHPWQDYLRTYGPSHLRRSSRGLRQLTTHIRKIDETANIKHNLPHQIGYIVGLQEIYARRVGLGGRIPKELGQLSQLRVLSMGNNHLYGELPAALGALKNLQRIVLHQNNLQGVVPASLGQLGCIVNLAGNPRLQHGEDVPLFEKEALMDLFTATKGSRWSTKTHWCSTQHVAKWYKVGVLTSHVHSIVMSSNGMEGRLPPSISRLTHLRMIELATMPGLLGSIPKELCSLTTLRRLCICRCGLTGRIPAEIGQLLALEELQLFGNQLSGAIPSSISLLTNLKLLSFGEYTGGNSFTPAPLPSCLSTLVNLEALFMANCYLKGGLPDWIGNLKELRQLDLQRNSLSGTIPRSVGLLDNLLYLNIKDNDALSGRLPLTELMSLTKLNRLSLVHCNFQNAEEDVEILKTALPRCKIWI